MKPGSSTRKFMVVTWTSGGSRETYHRSEPAAYREVRETAKQVADGISRVTSVEVKKWEYGKWGLFERFTKDELLAVAA